MTEKVMIDEELEEETYEGIDVSELRLQIYPLDALRELGALTGPQLMEQVHFWFSNYDQMWYKHDSEFIFDHLVRDMLKLGVNYQDIFVADTSDFFTIIAKDSGEQGGATLNKVWKERKGDAAVSVVHHARAQAYGWLNQRQKLPGRQTPGNLVHNYFTVQHNYIKLLHWTALVLWSLKQHWPMDERVIRIDALMAKLNTLDFSVRNVNRQYELSEITQQLQSL
ncbi:hypothetical protein [Erwinia phage vB_Ea277G]|nr:hypothetical protein [Erwinia phage vB_Ea277G]